MCLYFSVYYFLAAYSYFILIKFFIKINLVFSWHLNLNVKLIYKINKQKQRKMKNIFYNYVKYISCFHTWKISCVKTDKGRLTGMPFLLLKKQWEKYFSYSLVILTYVCIPRLDDEGRIQSRGIRGRLFAAVNTSVDAKRHKYRWLLWWNRVSRFSFSHTISFNRGCLSLILCTIRRHRSRFLQIQLSLP